MQNSEAWVVQVEERSVSKTFDQRELDKRLYGAISEDIPDIPETISLIEKGATNDHVDSIGWTALYIACKD